MTIDANVYARFWKKVDRTAECWVWTAGTNQDGYGRLRVSTTDVQSAHRISWEMHRGPIPEGLFVCHNCPGGDNPRCVNPAHLFLGSNADNMSDMLAKGRHANASKSHCKNGHPFDVANTYVRPDGHGRECRACNALAVAQHRLAGVGQ